MKKVLLLLLVVLLGILPGCSNKNSSRKGEYQDINLIYDGTWGPLVEEKADLRVFFTKESYSLSGDTEIQQWIGDELNLNIIGTSSRINVNDDKDFNLHAVDGFPSDIVGGYNVLDSLAGYISHGAFYPLNDYLDYMPNFKAFLETPEGEIVRKTITLDDGNMYYIPAVADGSSVQAWYLRKDWLEDERVQAELSFEGLPQTTAEYKELLEAYRDIILGGNDFSDNPTAPMIVDAWYFMRLPVLFGARTYDRNGEHILLGDDHKLYDAFMHEDMRDAIVELNQWYEEGLFNWDIIEGSKQRDFYWSNNIGGAIYDAGSAGAWGTRPDAPEGFEVVSILPPINEKYGTRLYDSGESIVTNDGWAISSYSANPELAAAYLDVWWSEYGSIVHKKGIEGLHWEYAGEKVIETTPSTYEKIIAAGGNNNYFKPLGADLGWPTIIFEFADIVEDPHIEKTYGRLTQEWYDEHIDSGEVYFNPLPALTFTTNELKEIANIKAQLIDWQYYYYFTAIIDSENPDIPTWEEYIQTCKAKGSDRLLEIYQEAYDRYRSK